MGLGMPGLELQYLAKGQFRVFIVPFQLGLATRLVKGGNVLGPDMQGLLQGFAVMGMGGTHLHLQGPEGGQKVKVLGMLLEIAMGGLP